MENTWERCHSGSDAGGSEPISFGYYSPDTLPLSFRRLAEANATKLSSYDKTSSFCLTKMSICAILNDGNFLVNFKPGKYVRKMIFSQPHRRHERK